METAKYFSDAIKTLQSTKSTPKAKVEATKAVANIVAAYNVPYMSTAGLYKGLEVWKHAPPSGNSNTGSGGRPSGTATRNTVSPPVARGSTIRAGQPRYSAANGKFRISHRELFSSVKPAGSAFERTTVVMNPGINEMFPWLNSLSSSFDQYRLTNLILEYVPTCATTEAGAIYLSWDPDPTDEPPVTKAQMVNQAFAVSSNAWKGFRFVLPIMTEPKFLRAGSVDQSLLLYDHGQLHVATDGTGTNQIGDLYVTYTIELIRPHTLSPDVASYQVQHYVGGASMSKTALLGNLPASFRGDTIVKPTSVTYVASALKLKIDACPSFIILGVRKWLVQAQLRLIGTAMNSVYSVATTGTATAPSSFFRGDATGIYISYTFLYTVDPTGEVITIDFSGNAATAITTADLNLMTGADQNFLVS